MSMYVWCMQGVGEGGGRGEGIGLALEAGLKDNTEGRGYSLRDPQKRKEKRRQNSGTTRRSGQRVTQT